VSLGVWGSAVRVESSLPPQEFKRGERPPPPPEGHTRNKKLPCDVLVRSRGGHVLCSLSCLLKLFGWYGLFASDVSVSVLFNIMKRWILPARACMEVLQYFSSKVFTSGRSLLAIWILWSQPASVSTKREPPGEAWSGRSLHTFMRSGQARLAV